MKKPSINENASTLFNDEWKESMTLWERLAIDVMNEDSPTILAYKKEKKKYER